MNLVVLIGRLTSDPSISYTPNTNTTVASFRLAVNKDTRDGGADFIQCKAFGKQAENLGNFKHKGDEIAITGRIETGSYKNRKGDTVYTTDVVCNRIDYTGRSRGEEGAKEHTAESKTYEDPRINDMVEGNLPDSYDQLDEDLPF